MPRKKDRFAFRSGFVRSANWTPATGLTNYIYAGSLLVARHHAGERLWYTLDRLGSPRLLTGQAGQAGAVGPGA